MRSLASLCQCYKDVPHSACLVVLLAMSLDEWKFFISAIPVHQCILLRLLLSRPEEEVSTPPVTVLFRWPVSYSSELGTLQISFHALYRIRTGCFPLFLLVQPPVSVVVFEALLLRNTHI